LNWFKWGCGALTAEGREACGDGMSQVAKQGDSPTAAGQAAQGRKQPWPAPVFSLVFMTGAWRHERQQGPVHQLSDGVTTSRAMACANGRGIWLLGNSGFNTLQNARIGILYSAYFARPNE